MSVSVVAWLEAKLAALERLATGAQGCDEAWTAVSAAFGPEVRIGALGSDEVWSREGAAGAWTCDDPYDDCASVRAAFMAEAELVAAFGSPAAVLRRVAADRQILAEHQPLDEGGLGALRCSVCAVQPGGDHYLYRVPWPCRTVLLLAEGYGWTGEST